MSRIVVTTRLCHKDLLTRRLRSPPARQARDCQVGHPFQTAQHPVGARRQAAACDRQAGAHAECGDLSWPAPAGSAADDGKHTPAGSEICWPYAVCLSGSIERPVMADAAAGR